MGDGDGRTATATAVVRVTYHQLLLVDAGVNPELTYYDDNGLVYTKVGAALVLTGIHTGVVNVGVELRAGPPSSVATAHWDEVAEVDLEAPRGQVVVTALMAEEVSRLPALTPGGPGRYRVRVHARGRDTDVDGVAFEPFEEYLLIAWPAAPAARVDYKRTDRFGAQWGSSSTSRGRQ